MSQPTYLIVSSTSNTGHSVVSHLPSTSPSRAPHQSPAAQQTRANLPSVQVCEKNHLLQTRHANKTLNCTQVDITAPFLTSHNVLRAFNRPTQPARPIRRRIRVPRGVPGRGRYVRRAHQHHGAERASDVWSVLCAVALGCRADAGE